MSLSASSVQAAATMALVDGIAGMMFFVTPCVSWYVTPCSPMPQGDLVVAPGGSLPHAENTSSQHLVRHAIECPAAVTPVLAYTLTAEIIPLVTQQVHLAELTLAEERQTGSHRSCRRCAESHP